MRSRRALIAGALCLFGASSKLSGCVVQLDLELRPCPCVAGYQCCAESNLCLPTDSTCPEDLENAGGDAGASAAAGGGSDSGGAPSSDAGAPVDMESAGAAGIAAEPIAGAAGAEATEPTEPQWSPLGDDGGVAPPLTYDPNLVLAPDGTPYIAYRACDPCEPFGVRIDDVPVVLRLGDTWQRLPDTGLSKMVKASPAVAIAQDGAPHVLMDQEQLVFRFDGAAWSPIAPALPLVLQYPTALEQDQDGRFYTLLWDVDNVKLEVARLDASASWSFLGTGAAGNSGTARLCVAGTNVYRAYVRELTPEPKSTSYIDFFDGNQWQPWGEFEGRSIELAASAAGELYAAVSDYELRTAQIWKRTNGSWEKLGQALAASWRAPLLQLSNDGALYLAYLVEDFPNVNRIMDGTWEDLKSRTLANGSVSPVLRLQQDGGTVVPIVSYLVGGELIARKYR